MPVHRGGKRIESFPPVISAGAQTLILGSMPGVASLQAARYYAHPQNQFWPIVGEVLGFDPALPYQDRLARLQIAGFALWDVLESCERPGSLDAAIAPSTLRTNDFTALFAAHPGLRRVLFNGASAESIFLRHVLPVLDLPASGMPAFRLLRLPSTSPANASVSRQKKFAAWRAALRPA
jgi:double-stranded uracil-DNA glycosylase